MKAGSAMCPEISNKKTTGGWRKGLWRSAPLALVVVTAPTSLMAAPASGEGASTAPHVSTSATADATVLTPAKSENAAISTSDAGAAPASAAEPVPIVPSTPDRTSGSAPSGSAPPEAASGETPSTESASGEEAAPTEPSPAPTEETPAADSSVEAPLEEGAQVQRVTGWRVRGYLRGEFKLNAPNLEYGYDEALNVWTPRGSPYMAFGMLAPETHDSYLEANAELKWSRFSNVSLYGDLSGVFSTTGTQQTTFEQLQDLIIGTGDLSASQTTDPGVPIPGAAGGAFVRREQERVLVNELYVNAQVPDWLAMTLGKRRMFYGSAFTWSPMDVINPPRNPLEPTLLREGSYNLTLDLIHFPAATLSFLYKPKVEESGRGLPKSIDFAKNLSLLRVYTNQFETDINVVGYLNQGRPYVGLSLARYVDVVELHLETLWQQGRPTYLVKTTASDVAYADYLPPYEVGQFELENGQPYGDILLGGTYTLNDSSFLIVEYLHRMTGMNQGEYELYRDVTRYMQEEMSGDVLSLISSSSGLDEEGQQAVQEGWLGLLGKAPYMYQEAYLRKNYMGITFMKSKIMDLFEPKLSLIMNLDDLSGTLYPSVDFVLSPSSGGRGSVKLMAGALIFLGGDDTQVSQFPNRFSANLRMTALF